MNYIIPDIEDKGLAETFARTLQRVIDEGAELELAIDKIEKKKILGAMVNKSCLSVTDEMKLQKDKEKLRDLRDLVIWLFKEY